MSSDEATEGASTSPGTEGDNLLHETLRRIVAENKAGRERSFDMVSRLVHVTATGDQDGFTRIARELTNPESVKPIDRRSGEDPSPELSPEEG